MPDVLSDLRKDLEKRLKALEPHVAEHAHILAALDALKGAGTRTRRTATAAARSATTAAHAATTTTSRSPASKKGAGGRGRPRGSGARAQEALRHVHGSPGITIGELAKKMKIAPNYLYRVLPSLEKDGKVKKHGKGYHAADAVPAGDEATAKSSRRRARKT